MSEQLQQKAAAVTCRDFLVEECFEGEVEAAHHLCQEECLCALIQHACQILGNLALRWVSDPLRVCTKIGNYSVHCELDFVKQGNHSLLPKLSLRPFQDLPFLIFLVQRLERLYFEQEQATKYGNEH